MKKSYGFFGLSVVFIILIVLVCATGCTGQSSGPGPLASDFTLPSLDGKNISLSDLKGQKVLLDFWATWCPPCRSEMPGMNDIVRDLKEKGVLLLNISTDQGMSAVKRFIKQNGFANLTVLHDDQGIAGEYGVTAIPTKVLIDEDGRIIGRHVGAMREKQLYDFVGL